MPVMLDETDYLYETVLECSPCAFLWVVTPGFVRYITRRRKRPPLPVSALNVAKAVMSMMLLLLTVVRLLLQHHYGYHCDVTCPVPDMEIASICVKCATFVLTACINECMRRCGVFTSGVPYFFWTSSICVEALPLYGYATRKLSCPEALTYYTYFVMLCVQLLLHSFSEKPSSATGLDKDIKLCPDERASVLSRMTYHWIFPIVWQAYRRKFKPSDMWEQTQELKSELVGPVLEKAWEEEKQRCHKLLLSRRLKYSYTLDNEPCEGRRAFDDTEKTPIITASNNNELVQPSLLRTLFRVYIWDWVEATTYIMIASGALLLQPMFLRTIVHLIDQPRSTVGADIQTECFMYAVGMFMSLCLVSVLQHVYAQHIWKLGLKVKTALTCLIYNKALVMKRTGAEKSTSVGEIVNLMSVDCQRIQDSFYFSYLIIQGVTVVGIAIAELWYITGVGTLGVCGVLVILLPASILIALKQHRLQQKILSLKGVRNTLLNEIVSGIKVIKMFAWEASFIEKVKQIRDAEIDLLWKWATLGAVAVYIAVHSPCVMLFCLITIKTLTSPVHELSAADVFSSLAVIVIVRLPVEIGPMFTSSAVQAYVSLSRIQDYLRTDDLTVPQTSAVTDTKNSVCIEGGYFKWTLDSPTVLRSINLYVRPGELIAVVGRVGAGKSSLISACLGEMETTKGHVSIQGSVAYVPQSAWIQNLTLRDNILFGTKFDEAKYNSVIDACALLPDLEVLDAGDMTEIGEKGINISGGQKQRVSLARAVYNNAHVYFLDDPLSAVDFHVGKHLFNNVIGKDGLLKNKTRILVTHSIHWLPAVDRIIVLNDGTISETGTYPELVSHNGPFAQFMQEYLSEHQQDDSDSEEEAPMGEMNVIEDILEHSGDNATHLDKDLPSTQRRTRHSKDRTHTSQSIKVQGYEYSPITPVDQGRLSATEHLEEGSIKLSVLGKFIRAMGVCSFISPFLLMLGFQLSNNGLDFLLSYWTEDPVLANQSGAGTPVFEDRYTGYMIGMAVLVCLQGLTSYFTFYVGLTRIIRACGRLHNTMLASVLLSPMKFFDTTPMGRILNRFSMDIDFMDNRLPDIFRLWNIMMFKIIAIIVILGIIMPIFYCIVIPAACIGIYLIIFYFPSAQLMRRQESISRSPVFNHFSETLTGASVIRAFKCGDRFVDEIRMRVDKNTKFALASYTASNWIGISVELLGNVIVLVASIFSIASVSLSGAYVGMLIMLVSQITMTLNLAVWAISEMQTNSVAVERVTEYLALPPEGEGQTTVLHAPRDWPRQGRVEFRNYETRYRAGLDLVLKGISFTIQPGEKVGVVGRTGSGKSTLMLSLCRMTEPAGGQIYIDGINIAYLELPELRRKLTVLPQDPVIFSGTLRRNLDPFSRYSDEEIWHVLDCAHLKYHVTSLGAGLEFECGEWGNSFRCRCGKCQFMPTARECKCCREYLELEEKVHGDMQCITDHAGFVGNCLNPDVIEVSFHEFIQQTGPIGDEEPIHDVGQRQLLCLARTLLQKTKVLILDEATAAVDMATDELIQDTIRTQFQDCTVISVAHRLGTVLDYDKILVLDAGEIAEYDTPEVLLKNPDSSFYRMAKDANIV